MSTFLYKCLTKATTAKSDQMKYGFNWMLSRRAILKVYDDHLECGDWYIDNHQIRDAVLYSIRSLFFIPGYILRIATDEKSYHFGLNGNRFWEGDLPFLVKREKGEMKYSFFSIIVRLILVAYLLWVLWKWIT